MNNTEKTKSKKSKIGLIAIICLVVALLVLVAILTLGSETGKDRSNLPVEGTEIKTSLKDNTEIIVDDIIENTETEVVENTEMVDNTETTESTEVGNTEDTEAIDNNGSTAIDPDYDYEPEYYSKDIDVKKLLDENGNPKKFSVEDLQFDCYNFSSFNECVESGLHFEKMPPMVYMYADNSVIITSDDDFDNTETIRIDKTVRGLKIGDSLDKLIKLYGNPEFIEDASSEKDFNYNNKKEKKLYIYLLKIKDTDKYYYTMTIRISSDNAVMGLIIEPIDMKYWGN